MLSKLYKVAVDDTGVNEELKESLIKKAEESSHSRKQNAFYKYTAAAAAVLVLTVSIKAVPYVYNLGTAEIEKSVIGDSVGGTDMKSDDISAEASPTPGETVKSSGVIPNENVNPSEKPSGNAAAIPQKNETPKNTAISERAYQTKKSSSAANENKNSVSREKTENTDIQKEITSEKAAAEEVISDIEPSNSASEADTKLPESSFTGRAAIKEPDEETVSVYSADSGEIDAALQDKSGGAGASQTLKMAAANADSDEYSIKEYKLSEYYDYLGTDVSELIKVPGNFKCFSGDNVYITYDKDGNVLNDVYTFGYESIDGGYIYISVSKQKTSYSGTVSKIGNYDVYVNGGICQFYYKNISFEIFGNISDEEIIGIAEGIISE